MTQAPWKVLSVVVLSALGVVMLGTAFDYGYSWDEPVQMHYGNLVLRFLASGGSDHGAIQFLDLYLYGGLFDGTVQLIADHTPLGDALGPFATRRLLTAATGLMCVVGCWKLARTVASLEAAFWSIVLLVAVPTFYANSFFNPKDIPFAAGYVWSVYYMTRVLAAGPSAPWSLVARFGVALGVTLGVRIGGGVLVAYHLLLLALGRPRGATGDATRAYLRWCALHLAVVAAIAYPLMVVLWPQALVRPFIAFRDALGSTSSFEHATAVLFMGELFTGEQLPRSYLPVYFAIKLPLFVSAGAAWGLVVALRARDRLRARGPLLLSLAFPPLFAIAIHSTHYDGIRHFLFVLPPLACLGGIGLADALDRIAARSKLAWRVALVILVAVLGVHLNTMRTLHPYQHIYYNALVGGVPGASGRYALDYWAISYKEAIAKLQAHVAPTPPPTPYKVAVCGPKEVALLTLDPRFQVVDDITEADFYLAFRKRDCDQEVDAPIIARVERRGVVLSVVKQLRPPRAGG